MDNKFRISVITPSYNSAAYLKDAIQSVLDQHYEDFEHIIVDGGSADGTVEILKQFDHLRWVSEPDNGQSDAMNKGFRMATGNIIVYLNADDYFLPGAFHKVVPYFRDGASFVVGKVKVENGDGSSWINDPKVTHDEMLQHWVRDAFCVNPVGYFYLKEVQENVPGFNPGNHIAMDLEFLLECSRKYPFTKIEEGEPLGVFRRHEDTKTAQSNADLEKLYSGETFKFIDKFLEGRSPEFIQRFQQMREEGYRNKVRSQFYKEVSSSKFKRGLFLGNKTLLMKAEEFRRADNKLGIIKKFLKRKLKIG